MKGWPPYKIAVVIAANKTESSYDADTYRFDPNADPSEAAGGTLLDEIHARHGRPVM